MKTGIIYSVGSVTIRTTPRMYAPNLNIGYYVTQNVRTNRKATELLSIVTTSLLITVVHCACSLHL